MDVNNAILVVEEINFEETFHFSEKMFNRIYA